MNVYEADDDEEWRLVISEVTAFMEVAMKNKDEFSFNRSRLQTVFLLLENPLGRTQTLANEQRQAATLASARSLSFLRSFSRIFE